MSRLITHATSLSLRVGPAWRGVLIMGPSGSGKSDLALRAIRAGCALVSDDYSQLWTSGGHLYASAPDTIANRLEIRGLGIMDEPARRLTRVHLAVRTHIDPLVDPIERLPEAESMAILGHTIPLIRLNPREASSVSKLLHRLRLAN